MLARRRLKSQCRLPNGLTVHHCPHPGTRSLPSVSSTKSLRLRVISAVVARSPAVRHFRAVSTRLASAFSEVSQFFSFGCSWFTVNVSGAIWNADTPRRVDAGCERRRRSTSQQRRSSTRPSMFPPRDRSSLHFVSLFSGSFCFLGAFLFVRMPASVTCSLNIIYIPYSLKLISLADLQPKL